MLYRQQSEKGFTLIELLIVIAIIAVLASVVFVSLDPLTRFRDARDSSRWNDITAVLAAIKVDQVDNGGAYLDTITDLTADTPYMISDAGDVDSCNAFTCDATIVGATDCVDLGDLVTEGYIGQLPVSPTGVTTWDTDYSGYYLIKSATGALTVGACESENADAISVTR